MDEEAEVVTTHTIDITPDPMGMWRWTQRLTATSFNEEATEEAVKLWFLTGMWPAAPAGTLRSIVRGELTMEDFLSGGEE